MLLFVNQGILVTASQGSKNEYDYNIATVVLLTEVLKLLLSTILYCQDNKLVNLVADIFRNTKLLALYFIPALLYCMYNNLAFANLATFDPTTYYLLLQLRVVITGVLFQIIFKKYLSGIQWFSLIMLTVGCMLKQVDFGMPEEDSTLDLHKNTRGFDLSLSAVFIVIQVLCSCFAGVYNEHLLKREGADVNIYVQNVFMYLDSIICNLAVLLYQGDIHSAFQTENLSVIFHYRVLVIMINNAIVGIITSFFLKSLNSILKTFASALELIIIAVLSYILFNIPIHMNTVLAIAVVSYAIILYSRNPVSNVKPSKEQERELLMRETV
ncbi:senju [Carabus blaptoides fortunei]